MTPASAAKTLSETKLVKTSDLPTEQYLEEAGDLERFQQPLFDFNLDPSSGVPKREYLNYHYMNDVAFARAISTPPVALRI